MKRPKVSIIVPVYNVEKYLRKCVSTILSQEMQDWELLLVNDGSTDNSGIICDGFAKEDSRIRVFHKPNGGVSSARNVGLDNARGEWFAFVDSDDEVDSTYIDLQGVPDDTNLVIKSFQVVKDDGSVKSSRIIEKEQCLSERSFLEYYIQKRKNALWDKLIRREAVGEVRFLENVRVGEDFLFILSCVPNIHKCYISPRGCYRYFLREGSVMSRKQTKSRKSLDVILANINYIINITKSYKQKDLGDSIIWISYLRYIETLLPLMTKEEKLYVKKLIQGLHVRTLKYASIHQILLSMSYYIKIILKLSLT